MRIAVGSDHAGFDLKAALASHLAEAGHAVSDLGADSSTEPVDYPLFGIAVGRAVAEGRADRGLSASAGRASASASRPTRSRASGPPWFTT